MHTVNKNNFHRTYLLQNYNIKINTSQSNLYKIYPLFANAGA